MALFGVVQFEIDGVVPRLKAERVARFLAQIVALDRGRRRAAQDQASIELAKLIAMILVDEIAEVGKEVEAVLDRIGLNLVGDRPVAPVPLAGQGVAMGGSRARRIDRAEAAAG